MLRRAFIFSIAISSAVVFAQSAPVKKFDLTIDSIMRGPALVGYQPENVRWSPDSSSVYFEWKLATDPLERDNDTWVVARDGSGLRRLTETQAKDAPPADAEKSRDGKRFVFEDGGDIFLWENGHRHALTRTSDTESHPHFTADEKRVTFVRGNNLLSTTLASGEEIQLTNIHGPDDKSADFDLWDPKKGTASQEYVKSEERKLLGVVDERARKREEDEAKTKREHPIRPFRLDKGDSIADAVLTADGRYVIATVATESDRMRATIVPKYVTESAYTETIPGREKAGDEVPTSRIAIFDTSNGEQHWVSLGIAPLQSPIAKETKSGEPKTAGNAQPLPKNAPPEEKQGEASAQKTEKSTGTQSESATVKERAVDLDRVIWSPDHSKSVILARAQDNKDEWILAIDPASAKARPVASFHDDAWIGELTGNVLGWSDNDTIYYTSEESGYAHLYSASYGSGRSRALTSGKWEVVDARLSPDRKFFYLTTGEESPFVRHLYRMPVSGGARVKLTSRDGDNEGIVSPDGQLIANVWSYTNVPPELFVQPNAPGGTMKQVTHSPLPEFFTYNWIDPPIVYVPARDGVKVPAHIYKPATWKAGGPAVIFVHGAGYLQNVDRWWSYYYREFMFHHLLMEHGYLVLDIDYRGSAGYGRDWRTAIYRHMGGKDLDDEVDAARWLVSEEGVDAKRIGMYGGSYGGFMTLMAMFTQPDVFAAGAALRPVSDWAHYNNGYTADILNKPQDDPEAYRRSSPIYFAGGLKGALLICHGMVDTNVHFQDSVRLAEKLIELRKTNWEIAPYPVEDHGFVEAASWADEYKRIFALFERTLR